MSSKPRAAKEKEKPDKTALVAATDILARREYSTRRLVEKLRKKGYEPDEIAAAIRRLMELHYLDDKAACERQFRYLYDESRQSVRQIVVKLLKRGFPNDIIKPCIPRDTFAREKAAALRVLALKFRPGAEWKKMMASLYRSGFNASAARAAIDDFQRENDENEDA